MNLAIIFILINKRVVVVEEPGEEPKLYRQDTGELVSNSSFTDPLVDGENNENPEELPKGKEKAKYASNTHSKLYKDIDELIENLRNEDSSLKNESEKKTNENDKTKSFNGRRNSIHMSTIFIKFYRIETQVFRFRFMFQVHF